MMEKSMPSFDNEKSFEKRRASEIVNEIESKNYSLIICEWGCKAFANISAVAMQLNNAELMTDFLDGRACEVIVAIMTKFAAVSQPVAAYGCAAILHLSWSSRDLREFFGEVSACEVVVYAISMHIGDPEISEYGSGVVGMLSKHNISNSFRLAEAGACDVMSQVGNFGFNLRHPKCETVASNVCYAFAQFAEAANSKRLMECGAGELITQLLRHHEHTERVVKAAVKALCCLASLNFQLRECLGQTGCCDIIVTVIRRFAHNTLLVQEGCEAILHLSLSPTNTEKLGNAGACETIVLSLRDQLMEFELGAEVCCGAMLNLVTYGTAAMENRNRLLAAGAVEQIKLVQLSTKASYRARENALQLLDIFQAMGGKPIGNGNNSSSNHNSAVRANGHGHGHGKNGEATVNGGSTDVDSSVIVPVGGIAGVYSTQAHYRNSIHTNSNNNSGNGMGMGVNIDNNSNNNSNNNNNGSSPVRSKRAESFLGVVMLASEVKGETIPLSVEVTQGYEEEELRYESFSNIALTTPKVVQQKRLSQQGNKSKNTAATDHRNRNDSFDVVEDDSLDDVNNNNNNNNGKYGANGNKYYSNNNNNNNNNNVGSLRNGSRTPNGILEV